ncbi:MAG: T9SS type A sorting domain-containing protein [Bacteroidia bacterium]|nr:T9SS type A sorting domain-containing protein [Bacteroidia bacterium]
MEVRGGDADNDLIAGRCYGAGGGGGGGTIYFKNTIPPVTNNTNGGVAGINIDNNGCAAPILPDAGLAGAVISSYAFSSSVDPSDDCPFALSTLFISFNARLVNQKVLLEWEADVSRIKSFIPEKSFSSSRWEKISELLPVENKTKYEFTDNEVKPGTILYRLKMIMKDNAVKYSLLKKINIRAGNHFTVYPNPAGNQVTITGNISAGETISLLDINGKTILKKKITQPVSSCTLFLPNMESGVYLLRIRDEMMKLVKQ